MVIMVIIIAIVIITGIVFSYSEELNTSNINSWEIQSSDLIQGPWHSQEGKNTEPGLYSMNAWARPSCLQV